MAKTMKRIVITAIILILLAAIACCGVAFCSSGTVFENARTAAINNVINTTGIKDTIDASLRSKASELAAQYGIPEQLLDGGIDMLSIQDWEVVNTPTDATVDKTVELDYEGSPIQITTYDDPSIISVKGEGQLNTYGQTITFSVPESAQGIPKLLPYLDAAEEIGAAELVQKLIAARR